MYWLMFMISCSFQDLSKSVFAPLYEALVRLHLEYGMPNPVADINYSTTRLLTTKRDCSGEKFRLA